MISFAAFRALSGADPAAVAMACETLRTRGFINYFGLQRFGSGCSSTHRQGHVFPFVPREGLGVPFCSLVYIMIS